ncbi:hypothetical protein AAKU55_001400 [Oxalobacteraceae bacterium GrIS 1.11]
MTIRLALLCAGALWCSGAQADCSEQDRREMKQNGMSETRIRRICAAPEDGRERPLNLPKPREGAPQQSNVCQTEVGSCALNRAGPAGISCWCNTAAGPARGKLVAR